MKNGEYDEQSEDSPQGTQQAGGRAFENGGPLASAEQNDDRENRARDQIDDGEYHQRHPPNRKSVQPFVHEVVVIPYLSLDGVSQVS
jgi:hypothetical protein